VGRARNRKRRRALSSEHDADFMPVAIVRQRHHAPRYLGAVHPDPGHPSFDVPRVLEDDVIRRREVLRCSGFCGQWNCLTLT